VRSLLWCLLVKRKIKDFIRDSSYFPPLCLGEHRSPTHFFLYDMLSSTSFFSCLKGVEKERRKYEEKTNRGVSSSPLYDFQHLHGVFKFNSILVNNEHNL